MTADKRFKQWATELAALLKASEQMVRPPIGKNERLARLVSRLRRVVLSLEDVDEDEFLRRLGSPALPVAPDVTPSEECDADSLRQLTLSEVEQRVKDSTTTKKQLLALASARFGASTGTLTRLSKSVLAEELLTMVMNERGHQSISRVAERGRGQRPGPEGDEGDTRGSE